MCQVLNEITLEYWTILYFFYEVQPVIIHNRWYNKVYSCDIKLVGYDNMYIPSLKGKQSYFDLIGIEKSRIEEYSFLGDSVEAFQQAKFEDRVQQYDE